MAAVPHCHDWLIMMVEGGYSDDDDDDDEDDNVVVRILASRVKSDLSVGVTVLTFRMWIL